MEVIGFATFHVIWRNRNEATFNKKTRNVDEAFVQIPRESLLWVSNRAHKVDINYIG